MGHRILTNCQHLDRHLGCRHAARRRPRWHPLRWLGYDRPDCVFIFAHLHRDGPEAVHCPHKAEIPRPAPPGTILSSRGGVGAAARTATIQYVVALAALASLAGCGDGGDRIQDTRDPCEFVLDFGTRCTPAGKTAICTHRRSVIARNTARECAP